MRFTTNFFLISAAWLSYHMSTMVVLGRPSDCFWLQEPSSVTNLTATIVGNSINFTWNGPRTIYRAYIYYGYRRHPGIFISINGSSQIFNYTRCGDHTFWVWPRNQEASLGATVEIIVPCIGTTDLPAVTNLRATSSEDQIQATWSGLGSDYHVALYKNGRCLLNHFVTPFNYATFRDVSPGNYSVRVFRSENDNNVDDMPSVNISVASA